MLDGEWNGVIGELSKKHADIGLGDFSVTEKRSHHSMLGLDATQKKDGWVLTSNSKNLA